MGAKHRGPIARLFSDNIHDAIVGRTPAAVLLPQRAAAAG